MSLKETADKERYLLSMKLGLTIKDGGKTRGHGTREFGLLFHPDYQLGVGG